MSNAIRVLAWTSALSISLVSAVAGAAEGIIRLTDPPRGKIDLTTEAPAPSAPRSYHLHDGFYLRLSGGIGPSGAKLDDNDTSGRDLEGSGQSLGFDLLIGGSPAPGVAIGGALLGQGAVSAEFDRGSSFSTQDRNFSLVLLGPFIDGFPMPNKGWHLGGMLGLASLNIEDDSGDALGDTGGFGGAAWFGYDFWVADEWSIGPSFRLAGSLTRNADDDVTASSLSGLFLFTALYH